MGTTEHLDVEDEPIIRLDDDAADALVEYLGRPAPSGHALLTLDEMDAQAAERDRRANCAARQAEQAQAQADALYALHALALTDRRFTAIADSPSLEALTRDADDLSEAADEARLEALRLGYVPR